MHNLLAIYFILYIIFVAICIQYLIFFIYNYANSDSYLNYGPTKKSFKNKYKKLFNCKDANNVKPSYFEFSILPINLINFKRYCDIHFIHSIIFKQAPTLLNLLLSYFLIFLHVIGFRALWYFSYYKRKFVRLFKRSKSHLKTEKVID
jgi:hypothetical protein